MNTLLSRCCMLTVIVVFAFSCKESETPACRIAKVYMEGEWHKAQYNSSGRLRGLVSENRKIIFYYDAMDRLISADIYLGDADPFYHYEFAHGPEGIVQRDEYHPSDLGTEHTRTIYHYSGPATVDYLIHQEFGFTEELGFEIRRDIYYSGGNVKHIDGTSSVIVTDYYGLRYDKKRNPFRVLAAAVGNDAFFPVGIHANFPVADYDISYLSLFSKNNPTQGQYVIPGVDPAEQLFSYSYHGNMAKSIKWENTSYGSTDTEEYAFEFECGRFKADE